MSPMIITFVILFICVIALVTNKVPMGVVGAFCPMALAITKVLTVNEAWAGFSNTATISGVALFVLGGGLAKTSLADIISDRVMSIDTKKENGHEQIILIIFGFTAMVMAILLSGAATVATLAPIIAVVCSDLNQSKQRVIKPVSDIANMWAGVLPIGAGASMYLTCNAILENVGSPEQFGFFDVAVIKAPILIVATLFIIFVVYRIMPNRKDFENDKQLSAARKQSKLSPQMEKVAYAVFFGTVVLMVLGGLGIIPVDTTSLAVLGALMMVLTGVENGKEALGSVSWPMIFIVGGFLPMATALNNTGAGELMANALQSVMGGQTNSYILAAVFLLVPLIATQFMNNIVVTNLFMAVEAAIAVNIGISPKFAITGALVAGTVAVLTPMASSPAALAYGAGEYNGKDFFISGLPVILVVLISHLIWVPLVIHP